MFNLNYGFGLSAYSSGIYSAYGMNSSYTNYTGFYNSVGLNTGYNLYGYDAYNGLSSAFNCFYGGGGAYNYANLGYFRGSIEQFSYTPIYRDVVDRRAFYMEQIEKRLVQREKIGKMRDYFFEYKGVGRTRTLSPIVLDLNGDGKFDVTDKHAGKDGRIDGRTVQFDIAPDKSTWSHRSYYSGRQIMRRLTPKQIQELKQKGSIRLKTKDYTRELGYRYRYAKQNKELELRWEKGKPVAYFGQERTKENVEWLKKGGKDGLLVWDVNGDGKITSSKELMGEYDIQGRRKFKNGYEKLAYYFDKNKDGVISGNELKGLKIWRDKNGDGITQKGELEDLSKYNITKLNTKMTDPKNMEANFSVGKNEYQTIRKQVLAGYQEVHRRELAGYLMNYSRMDFEQMNYNYGYGGYGFYGGGYIF